MILIKFGSGQLITPKIFWKSIWDFTKVKGDLGDTLLKESNIFFKNRFFPDARLNYAKNLLKKNGEKKSIIFKSENGYKTALSWKEFKFKCCSSFKLDEIQAE